MNINARRYYAYMPILALLLFTSLEANSTPQFTLRLLSDLTRPTMPTGINDFGDISGYESVPGGFQSVKISSNGLITRFGEVDSTFASGAFAINNSFDAVGTIYAGSPSPTGFFSRQAVVFNAAGQTLRLAGLGGSNTVALGINTQGDIVGHASTPNDTNYHATLFSFGLTSLDLGGLGGKNSQANAVSDRREIVGAAEMADGSVHATLFTEVGANIDLGILAGGTYSTALAVNDIGQAVGQSTSATSRWARATIFSLAGHTPVDLGAPEGYGSRATGINNLGQVVGDYSTYTTEHYAFLWEGGQMFRLDDLLSTTDGYSDVHLVLAAGINELGQIAAYGTVGGFYASFLLSPVPELSSATLMSFGLIFVALWIIPLVRIRKRVQDQVCSPAARDAGEFHALSASGGR